MKTCQVPATAALLAAFAIPVAFAAHGEVELQQAGQQANSSGLAKTFERALKDDER